MRSAVLSYVTLTVLLLVVPCSTIWALVVIDEGESTTNPGSTAFGEDPGWANAAFAGSKTAVYLGDGWVLTVAHGGGVQDVTFEEYPNPTSMTTSVETFKAVSATACRINNPVDVEGFDSTATDLLMYRVSSDGTAAGTQPVNLPGVSISSTAPAVGDQVVMIGRGRVKNAATTYTDPDFGTTYDGFTTTPGVMSWGTNEVASSDKASEPIDTGSGDVQSLATVFNYVAPGSSTPPSHEAQAQTSDSGAPVFAKISGSWKLVGIVHAVGGYTDQDVGSTAIDLNETYFADLAFESYHNQIGSALDGVCVSAVPEPSSAVVLGLVALVCGIRKRFSRR